MITKVFLSALPPSRSAIDAVSLDSLLGGPPHYSLQMGCGAAAAAAANATGETQGPSSAIKILTCAQKVVINRFRGI